MPTPYAPFATPELDDFTCNRTCEEVYRVDFEEDIPIEAAFDPNVTIAMMMAQTQNCAIAL